MPKKTEEQIALEKKEEDERRRSELRLAHSTPTFNLFGEPWIDVIGVDGRLRSVSLDTLFRDAHLILDIAEADPLINVSLRRLLIALTIQLVRLQGNHDAREWRERLESSPGFTSDEVDGLMADQKDYFWLWHPERPFLQDLRLIGKLTVIDKKPISDMVPFIPSSSEAAWLVKPESRHYNRLYTDGGLAKLLTGRWFYNLTNNSGWVIMPTAKNGTYSYQLGGVFANPSTQFFRASNISLFRSLLRNITDNFFNRVEGGCVGPAWMDGNYPSASEDPLYLYTATSTSALLGTRSSTAKEQYLVRGAVPKEGDRTEIFNQAQNNDPHVCRYERGKETPTVKLLPSAHRSKVIEQLVASAHVSANVGHKSVVSEGSLWLTKTKSGLSEHYVMLSTKMGTKQSKTWEDIKLSPDMAADLTYEQSETFQHAVKAVNACFTPTKGMYDRLWMAIRRIALQGDESGKSESSKLKNAIAGKAMDMWMDVSSEYMDMFLSRDIDIDEFWSRMRYATIDVFDKATDRYSRSLHYAPQVIEARSWLKNQLKEEKKDE